MKIHLRFLPSTEKCFMDERITDKFEIGTLSMLKNERLQFQLAYAAEELEEARKITSLQVESEIARAVRVERVEQVPVVYPKDPTLPNRGHLRTTPGLYPDLLLPIEDQPRLILPMGELRSLFVTVEDKEGLPAGDHTITFSIMDEQMCLASASITVHVIDAMLPEQTLIHTEWFHGDGLAQYYDLEVFSERYWQVLENYLRAAREHGVNMILTPTFTPPLDTYVGGERLTVQLVDVEKNGEDYTFGYERLDRFVALCQDLGFRYFEIAHLFTQWGAMHAPKVIARVDGVEQKLFGWQTDAHGPEYRQFVRAFLTDFVAHAKTLGIADRCYYHISDEPRTHHMESYLDAKSMIWDIVGEKYHVIDALSDYAFYENGAVVHPVPATNHIEPFLANKVPELWTYYCISQGVDASNRFVSMPGTRTRAIGLHLFAYDIVGFLHWGFNFYNCQYSHYPINPILDPCGEYFAPAGDTLLVYPGPGGKPYRSLHGVQFYDALTDLRAMQLLSSLVGKEAVMEMIRKECKEELTFMYCPLEQSYYVNLRKTINEAIEKALGA